MKKTQYATDEYINDVKDNCKETSFDLFSGIDWIYYKDFILNHVSFAKVLKSLRLEPEDSTAGKYTHRMVCPFKFHKNGRERTGSFRFNEDSKTFICFGCSTRGDMLDFLRLYVGGCEQYHLEKLARIAGLVKDDELQVPADYVVEPIVPKETNYKILFNMGLLVRQYLLDIRNADAYLKECRWADQVFIKVDEYFNSIDEENVVDAQSFYDSLQANIQKRKMRAL